jgi:DNA-binding transcriptional LysR family regulator
VTVVIGAGDSVIQSILIPALVGSGGDGKVKLVFRNLQSATILTGLRNRRLDIGIAHDSGGHAELKSKRLLRYGVRLIARDSRLGRSEIIGWTELKSYSLALPESDSELRRTVDESMARGSVRPPVMVECTSHAQVVEAAMRKGVAGIVPEFVAARAVERGLVSLPVAELEGYSRELRVLWHPAAVEMKPQIEGCVRQILAALKD